MYIFKPYAFTKLSSKGIVKANASMAESMHCDGKNLYISPCTGEPDSKPSDVWVYNLAGKQWRLMRNDNNLPKYPNSAYMNIYEPKKLIKCLFQMSNGFELLPVANERKCRLQIYDLNTGSALAQETSGQIPYYLISHNFIRHGKYLYSVGKSNEETFSDVYKLDIENGLWEVVYSGRGLDANDPVGKTGHNLVYDNNMIYIFSAFSDNLDDWRLDGFSFDKIPAFDLENCCWKTVKTHGDENHIPHYPTKRENFAVTSYTDPDSGETNVIISGGAAWKYFDDVWRLNLTSLKWTCLERFGTVLPCRVDGHLMTVSPAGKLFTCGGGILNNTTSIFTPHSTWLRIPKLTDICWEAVVHYYPDLTSMGDKEIISLGIKLDLLKLRIN